MLEFLNNKSAYPFGPRRTLVLIAGTLTALLLASVNQTLTVAALPSIVADLGGLDHYSWVFSSYILATTITIPIYGKLSDLYGRRPLFVTAIAFFSAGSLVSGLAPSMAVLIGGRTLQGIGAGGLNALGFALLADIMAPRERGRWEALNSSVFAMSAIGGPFFGGWIADAASWRWNFFISLPLAVAALAIVWFGFGHTVTERRSHQLDYVGALLFTGGAGLGLLAASSGGKTVAWGSPEIVVAFVACVLLLVAFVAWEQRFEEPLIPLGLLRGRTIASAEVALFAVGAAMFGTITLVPLFVHGVLGESTTTGGRVLIPVLLAWFAGSMVAGQIVSRTGRPRPVLLLGPPVAAVGFALLMTMDAGTSTQAIAGTVGLIGFGLGTMMQTLVVVVQNDAPRAQLGVATGTTQFARSIGSAIGVTVTGAIVAGSASGLLGALHVAFGFGLGIVGLGFVAILLLPDGHLSQRLVPLEAPDS